MGARHPVRRRDKSIGYEMNWHGWVADLFVDGTLGPQPVGNTIHGGAGLRVNY
jgi:hypothetical protein